jgi:hypothetical protein
VPPPNGSGCEPAGAPIMAHVRMPGGSAIGEGDQKPSVLVGQAVN